MSDLPERRISRREFEAVIQRAAELASSEPEAGDAGFTEAEVLRIARDVGLSPHHVERALAEVRWRAEGE
ncbi:MAG: hypothetical protein D6701_13175, partial [Gemmatimonadetes bacterium]